MLVYEFAFFTLTVFLIGKKVGWRELKRYITIILSVIIK